MFDLEYRFSYYVAPMLKSFLQQCIRFRAHSSKGFWVVAVETIRLF